jgi:NhaA family Na+:H+ antiporter
LIVANSPLSEKYFRFLELSFSLEPLKIDLELTILKSINYGLMTIFFFVVGLEIKRELTSGHLSKIRQAAAPFFAALGGMAIPALIYLAIAGGSAPEGWAIPVATDIALAVGVLVLMGARATSALRSFLLALAVIDDIGAILIIAIVFSAGAVISWLVAAFGAVIATLLLKKIGVMQRYVYFIVGALLWFSLYKSGLHPTLAGVVMGLLTPATPINDGRHQDLEDGTLTIVEKLQGNFHGFSAFVVIPIFAFANAGVSLSAQTLATIFTSPIAWGIICGLALGKPIGVLIAAKGAAIIKLAQLPEGTNTSALVAVGSTAGIGFTVSIFIAKLAFTDPALQDLAVTAVMVGSLISGLIGVALFRLIRR